MNTHYIPKLLLRPFATGEKINTYNFATSSFEYKKLKNTFADSNLYDGELEQLFANKLEGPIGDLLNHKLLHQDTITLSRQENLLLRKFMMINFLRAPIVNTDWDEMVKRTKLEEHASVQMRERLLKAYPELRKLIENGTPSAKDYIDNLKKAMEIDSLEDLAEGRVELGVSESLKHAARMAMVSVIAIWDSEKSKQEFILPKLPGITEMDNVGITYKSQVLESLWLPDDLDMELRRLLYGSMYFPGNYSVHPISPTRCIICFSPYFRAFFPIMDTSGQRKLYPPLLKKEQFNHHFYKPLRMELFQPCNASQNRYYTYRVRALSEEEVFHINSILLDMETEEFAFHDRERLKNLFSYYDQKAVFAYGKKHDFSNL